MFNTALDKYFIRALNILHFTELLKVALCANDPKFSKLHSCGPRTQPTQMLGMEGMGEGRDGVVLKPKRLNPITKNFFSFLLFKRRAAESFLRNQPLKRLPPYLPCSRVYFRGARIHSGTGRRSFLRCWCTRAGSHRCPLSTHLCLQNTQQARLSTQLSADLAAKSSTEPEARAGEATAQSLFLLSTFLVLQFQPLFAQPAALHGGTKSLSCLSRKWALVPKGKEF